MPVGWFCFPDVLSWKGIWGWVQVQEGFPDGSGGKKSACNAGDLGSVSGLGRFPGEGNGKALQYSCLGNPMDRGAWWATVHGVAKCWTWVTHFTFRFRKKECCDGLVMSATGVQSPCTCQKHVWESLGSHVNVCSWRRTAYMWVLPTLAYDGPAVLFSSQALGSPVPCSSPRGNHLTISLDFQWGWKIVGEKAFDAQVKIVE